MSKPATIYRLNHQSFDPTDDNQVYIDIADNDNLIEDDETQEIVSVAITSDRQSVIDNDEDPLTVIRAQQLTITFISTDRVNGATFFTGSDQRWSVHKYLGDDTQTLFRGWLNTEDISELFMPRGSEVTLTANDGLGPLKDIPLTDFNDELPVGKYKIIDILAMALSNTGLSLQINVAFNVKLNGFISDVRTPGTDAQHLFDTCYLWAKSLEDSQGTTIDCYSTIKMILGEEACLFQRQGMWWVMRVDEIELTAVGRTGLYISTFESDGTFIENLGERGFVKRVGKDSPYEIFFSRESSEVVNNRPRKSVKITYDYNFPEEIVDNIDFSRGDLITTVSATEKHFNLDDWILLRGLGSAATVPNISTYIQRNYTNDYETERFVVLTMPPVFAAPVNFIRSNPVEIGVKDKFDYSFDFRFPSDKSGGGTNTVNFGAIRLVGDDSTYWSCDGDGVWHETDSNWTAIFPLQEQWDCDDVDESEWRTISVSANPTPVAGSLYFDLFAMRSIAASQFETDIHYSNVIFDYIPYINGSYQKYTGQSQTVSQDGNYKPKREVTVGMSESPRKLFKGAIQIPLSYNEIFSGSVTFITGNEFRISGYQLEKFRRGQRINILNTTSNNIATRVTSVSYDSGTGNTIVLVEGATTSETDGSTTIQEMTFELATEFYNAAVYPTGPPSSDYVHPYSEIQVYDVWNQFNREMRVFRATLQGMELSSVDSPDSLTDHAHLIHKWVFTDAHEHTNNKFFLLMTFDQDYRNAEWTGVFRECYDVDRPKVYTGRSFKYEQ